MIPGNAIQTPRLEVDDVIHPVQPPQSIKDVLAEFAPGQKVMAQVMAMLPNGTYRATIAQRDVTLALPFAVKTGDALELEIVDNDGQKMLAVSRSQLPLPEVDEFTQGTGQDGKAGSAGGASSAQARISPTGQFISALIQNAQQDKNPQVALNNGQPLLGKVPAAATPPDQLVQQLQPTLKTSLAQSGLFYESHLAQWISGRKDLVQLGQEPQNRFQPSPVATSFPSTPTPSINTTTSSLPVNALPSLGTEIKQSPTNPLAFSGTERPGAILDFDLARPPSTAPSSSATPSASTSLLMDKLPGELQHIAQQQLQSLGTGIYQWQGQLWPGMNMQWDIIDPDGQPGQPTGDGETPSWQTRLNVRFPSLGGLSAVLSLHGNELQCRLVTEDDQSRNRLQKGELALRQRLLEAGLTLSSLGIQVQGGDTVSSLPLPDLGQTSP